MATYPLLRILLVESNWSSASEMARKSDPIQDLRRRHDKEITRKLRSPKFWLISYALFGRCFLVLRSVPGSRNATIVMNLFPLLAVLAICLSLGELSIATLFVVVMLMGIGTSDFVLLDVSCIKALCRPENTKKWLVGLWYRVVYSRRPSSCRSTLAGHWFFAAVLFSDMISAVELRWLALGR
ncbi:hypothetical protein P885DRAFT_57816 [Corynascus similis CBS 632.67]